MSFENEQCRVLVEQGRLTEDQARYAMNALQGQKIDVCELLMTWGHIGASTAEMVRLLVTQGSQQKIFGKYEILGELSRGGMGVVYKACHNVTKKVVALKLMLDGSDAEESLRFRREAQALAKLSHRHIVPIFDCGYHNDVPYFTMELVEGKDLKVYVQDCIQNTGALPDWKWTCAVIAQVAEALEVCHELGLYHRDIKPDNILIRSNNQEPILVDFGLVKVHAQKNPGESIAFSLTSEGQLLGTPAFMAPEQYDAVKGAVGAPADVWGLTATLFFCLTGRRPFEGESPFAVYMNVKKGLQSDQLNGLPKDAPDSLRQLIPNGFELEQNARITMSDLGMKLSRALEMSSAQSKKGQGRGVWIGLFGAILCAAMCLLYFQKGVGQKVVAKKPVLQVQFDRPLYFEMTDRHVIVATISGVELASARFNNRPVLIKGSGFSIPLEGVLGKATLKLTDIHGVDKVYDFKVANWSEVSTALKTQKGWRALPDWQKISLCRELAWQLGEEFQFDSLQEYSAGGRRHRVGLIRHKQTDYVFHLLPGGHFEMGTDETEEAVRFCRPYCKKGRKARTAMIMLEWPPQRRKVRPFLLGRYEVSRGVWEKVLNDAERVQFLPGQQTTGNEPVMGLKWDDVNGWLAKVGQGFRFPKEYEWEYACRAGTDTQFFWGDKMPAWANHNDGRQLKAIEAVSAETRRTNAFGLVHMAGNVCEWVAEPYYNYDGRRLKGKERTQRLLRGGSYKHLPTHSRSRARLRSNGLPALRKEIATGFRVALSLPEDFLKD